MDRSTGSTKIISVETPTHGRVLIKDAADGSPLCLVVGFHGYALSAEDMLSELELIPGCERWTLASIQALHRFYSRRQESVVASWMTRQDRDEAVADNIAYVDRVVEMLVPDTPNDIPYPPLIFVGFSQGVGMAYRAAVLGTHRPRCIVAVGGDVPPEVKTVSAEKFPSILIAAGERDEFYTSSNLETDETFLRSHGVRLDVFRYPGGHEWTAELRHRISSAVTAME